MKRPFAVSAATLMMALATVSIDGAAASQAAEGDQLQVWRLDCGSFSAPTDQFSDLLSHPGERSSYVDSCFLVRHGKDVLMWDAGMPAALLNAADDATATVRMRLTVTIAGQLARLGLRPADVTMLAISHNHSDHTGQAGAFAGARLVMDKSDFDALYRQPAPFFTDPSTLQPWLAGRAPTQLISGDCDLFGDGSVVMVALPGHTPGNHGLLVRLPHFGPILISGDALHASAQLTSHAMPPTNPSRADSLASLDRIEGLLRQTRATLIIEHDPGSIARLPLFPESAK